MRQHEDYINILIDKILELNAVANNDDDIISSTSSLYNNYSALKVCWREIVEIAKLADAQRQEWAGK